MNQNPVSNLQILERSLLNPALWHIYCCSLTNTDGITSINAGAPAYANFEEKQYA